MSIFNVITLFGGLALFLYGMRLMSNGLKEGSTGTLKMIMEKATNNLFKAFLLGLLVTAIIQSSTATIVITSGLVAAGVISLKQSIGIIVGANVGTTVTGQIIRLMDLNSTSTAWLQFFKPATLAPIALIVGIILIMFIKFEKSDVIGQILMGFGILFTGLMNMTNAVSVLSASGAFDGLFSMLGDNPVVGYLIGAGVSFILQSSSATIGILQAFSFSGQLYFKSIYAVLVGIYLGDCLTTSIVCSIGANADAKRVGIMNVIFNLSETAIVFITVSLLHSFGILDSIWNVVANSGIIANTNTIFNLSCAILLFPIVSKYELLAKRIVKDDENELSKYNQLLKGLNEKFFSSPAIAFNSVYNVLITMFSLAKDNINKSFSLLFKYDNETFLEMKSTEKALDTITDRAENYLVQLNTYISNPEHARIMNQYHNLLIEFERLGDHAINIAEYAKRLYDTKSKFSEKAYREIDILKCVIDDIMDRSYQAFTKRDLDAANGIEPIEEIVDEMVDTLKDNHLERLEKGKCSVESGTIFLNILNDIERISDVCSNVGETVIARVLPEYAGKMHKYMAKLHHGENEQFNKEYENAYKKYYSELERIEK